MVHVTSAAITDIVYDADARILGIRFVDGDWYAYADVPPDEHAAFLSAPSLGRHFAARIRDRYRHAALDAAGAPA